MAEFNKSSGGWIDKKSLKNGDQAKLVTEAVEQEGQNGKQIVAKIRIKGSNEAVNVAINAPTKNALIDAYGKDSKEWVGKLLSIHTETGIFAGKRGIALYLIPEGFALTTDEAGYVVIAKQGTATSIPVDDYPDEDIDVSQIPF